MFVCLTLLNTLTGFGKQYTWQQQANAVAVGTSRIHNSRDACYVQDLIFNNKTFHSIQSCYTWLSYSVLQTYNDKSWNIFGLWLASVERDTWVWERSSSTQQETRHVRGFHPPIVYFHKMFVYINKHSRMYLWIMYYTFNSSAQRAYIGRADSPIYPYGATDDWAPTETSTSTLAYILVHTCSCQHGWQAGPLKPSNMHDNYEWGWLVTDPVI